MNNIAFSPEKFGLRTIGQVEFSSGAYEFDTTIVWQDTTTGALYYGHDSGCSCPCPFDDIGRHNITEIRRLQDLVDHLHGHRAESGWYDPVHDSERAASIDAQIVSLIARCDDLLPRGTGRQ